MHEFQFLDDPPTQLSFTCSGTDPKRVIVAFENVSRYIPPDERRLLLDHWRKHPFAPTLAVEDIPYIQVKRVEDRGVAIALNENGQGLLLRFAAGAIDEMSNELLEILIAHELAHTVINCQIFSKCLPAEEQASFAKVGLDIVIEGEITEEHRRAMARQTTAWSEKAADDRTLRWNPSCDCARIRDWMNDYFKRHGVLK
jgi:hypothetical protein